MIVGVYRDLGFVGSWIRLSHACTFENGMVNTFTHMFGGVGAMCRGAPGFGLDGVQKQNATTLFAFPEEQSSGLASSELSWVSSKRTGAKFF